MSNEELQTSHLNLDLGPVQVTGTQSFDAELNTLREAADILVQRGLDPDQLYSVIDTMEEEQQ